MVNLADELRDSLDAELAVLPAERLAEPVQRLIAGYRGGRHAARPFVTSETDAAAYAAYRMPATYAAVRAALAEVTALAPDLGPLSQLDLGGGTGAAAWAAADIFPTLDRVTVLDQVGAALTVGRRLAQRSAHPTVQAAQWRQWTADGDDELPRADLVTISYVLGELPSGAADDLLRRAGAAAGGLVLVVEPGTPAGYERVIAARAALLDGGLDVVAPCPHNHRCPMLGTHDWCHFPARLNRSALHRRLKGGELGYEDEKFSYVAAAVRPARRATGRVVRHPMFRKGLVTMSVCGEPDGVRQTLVSKRQGPLYRLGRDVRWGAAWPPVDDGPDTGADAEPPQPMS